MAKGKYHEWLTDDGLLLLRKWARNGLTDEEIAKNIGISTVTLYDWKKKHIKISNALKKTKEVYDSEVEEALENAALGYFKTEREWRRDPETGEMVLYREYERWFKPDTTAQIFWLKNRDKLHWRDRQDVNLETDGDDAKAIAVIPKREILEQPKGEINDVTD